MILFHKNVYLCQFTCFCWSKSMTEYCFPIKYNSFPRFFLNGHFS
uniref:Uncharacterized protein n=1 Tax=Anguilla anguilla TaxID=7936 RepID=A0A0E9XWC6_ANGAN